MTKSYYSTAASLLHLPFSTNVQMCNVCLHTLYHSCSSWSENSVFSLRSCSISGRSLLFCFPMLAGRVSWFPSQQQWPSSESQAASHTCQSETKTQEVSNNNADGVVTSVASEKWNAVRQQTTTCRWSNSEGHGKIRAPSWGTGTCLPHVCSLTQHKILFELNHHSNNRKDTQSHLSTRTRTCWTLQWTQSESCHSFTSQLPQHELLRNTTSV